MLEATEINNLTIAAKKTAATKLPLVKLVGFSLPLVPLMLLQIPLNSFLPTFYAQETGISLTNIGIVFLLARLFDMLLNPVSGILSDNSNNRLGRRRSWVLLGTPVVLLGCYFAFFPPAVASSGYLLLWLIVLQTGLTLISVPHYSLGGGIV